MSDSLLALPNEECGALLCAAEALLAELGVTEPGAATANGDHEEPAAMLLDGLYSAWNAVMCKLAGQPDGIFEPEPYVVEPCCQVEV